MATKLNDEGAALALEGWRYLKAGRVRHDTDTGFIDGPNYTYRYSRCGVGTAEEHWLGTGTQEEYEKLATMKPCLRCL